MDDDFPHPLERQPLYTLRIRALVFRRVRDLHQIHQETIMDTAPSQTPVKALGRIFALSLANHEIESKFRPSL